MSAQGARETQAAWDAIAAGYDEVVTPTHIWLGNEGLRRAAVGPGTRFLDVAAGSGALAIPAARLGAEVIAVDISTPMLEQLARRARLEDLSIETRAMDGHELELDDATFDAAGSQFGVMLFPDMPRALREMARVTRPGGRVLMTVYGPPSEIEFFRFFIGAVQAVVPAFTGPPADPVPLPFQLQDPQRLRRELESAGLHDVRVETIIEKLEFRTGGHLWAWLTSSNPIVGDVLAELDLTAAQTAHVQDELQRQVRARAPGSRPAVLTNPIHIGVGTR